jgi:iron(III) transport system substrate-binding protein
LPVTRPGVAATKFIPPTSALSNAVDSLVIVSGPEQNKTIDIWRETFGIR